ncbi:hypothetical protein DFH07DRAFT_766520 [Mycena maculata]|uniref:Uncharacterized protein n=1 Tax=Mycena maculata TaxID=230809 RepID=A0AAD7K2A1_9AGAR|nr:hypothetical protein DFH07DRAFT_766520 [Mycena maculata]
MHLSRWTFLGWLASTVWATLIHGADALELVLFNWTTLWGFVKVIKDFSANTPLKLLFEYLWNVSKLGSPPYRWDDTQMSILPGLDHGASFSGFKVELEWVLENVVYTQIDRFGNTKPPDWIDTLIFELFSWWQPNQASTPTPIPNSLIHYFNHHSLSDDELRSLGFSNLLVHLWPALPITLAQGPSGNSDIPYPQVGRHTIKITQVLVFLWHVVSLEEHPWIPEYEVVLSMVGKVGSSAYTSSVADMLKTHILSSLAHYPPPLHHSLLPMEMVVIIPRKILEGKITDKNLVAFDPLSNACVAEAQIILMAEFLEGIDRVPYKATKTLLYITGTIPCAGVHKHHQIRLANAMQCVLDSDQLAGGELLNAIINGKLFNVYAGLPHCSVPVPWPLPALLPPYVWLDNHAA